MSITIESIIDDLENDRLPLPTLPEVALKVRDTAADENASIIDVSRIIETDAALFDSGLGLDSIDALEIAIALENSYGVTIADDPEKNQEIFASVASLARFVGENRPA